MKETKNKNENPQNSMIIIIQAQFLLLKKCRSII